MTTPILNDTNRDIMEQVASGLTRATLYPAANVEHLIAVGYLELVNSGQHGMEQLRLTPAGEARIEKNPPSQDGSAGGQ